MVKKRGIKKEEIVILFIVFSVFFLFGCESYSGKVIYETKAPYHTQNPVLNSTDGTNYTDENLTCYAFTTDSLKDITNWYKNGNSIIVVNMPFEGGSNSTHTRDYSGNGYNGTVSGAIWNSTGGYDGFGAYEFDGVNDMIVISDGGSISLPEFTLSVWIKPKFNGTDDKKIFSKGNIGDPENSNFDLDLNPDSSIEGFFENNNGFNMQVNSNAKVALNQWSHIALRYDSSTNNFSIYINGSYDTSTTTTYDPGSTTNPLHIGGCVGTGCSSANFFNGTIDDIRIYDYSLSAEQISALYNSRNDLIVLQETTIGDNWTCSVTPNDRVIDGTTNISNWLLIADNLPWWSNNKTNILSPATYSSLQNYQFNITWEDNIAVSEVIFEHNFTGSAVNYSVSGSSLDEYYYDYSNLAAGNYYWKSYANDSLNQWSNTPKFSYIVNKAIPVLTLNASPSWSENQGVQTNISCTADTGQVIPSLFRNNALVSNPDIQTLTPGTYNYICNNTATQNYTSAIATNALYIIAPTCGNNITEFGEECDDNNTISGDGCSASCIIEFCGDDIKNNNTEVCDGIDLDGKDCTDFNSFTKGTLSCSLDCLNFDTSGCTKKKKGGRGRRVVKEEPVIYYTPIEVDEEPEEPEFEEPIKLTCNDSDVTAEYPDGKNYYEKGITTNDLETKEDFCVLLANLQYRLTEYYCDDGNIMSEEFICNECVDGECIPEFVPVMQVPQVSVMQVPTLPTMQVPLVSVMKILYQEETYTYYAPLIYDDLPDIESIDWEPKSYGYYKKQCPAENEINHFYINIVGVTEDESKIQTANQMESDWKKEGENYHFYNIIYNLNIPGNVMHPYNQLNNAVDKIRQQIKCPDTITINLKLSNEWSSYIDLGSIPEVDKLELEIEEKEEKIKELKNERGRIITQLNRYRDPQFIENRIREYMRINQPHIDRSGATDLVFEQYGEYDKQADELEEQIESLQSDLSNLYIKQSELKNKGLIPEKELLAVEDFYNIVSNLAYHNADHGSCSITLYTGEYTDLLNSLKNIKGAEEIIVPVEGTSETFSELGHPGNLKCECHCCGQNPSTDEYTLDNNEGEGEQCEQSHENECCEGNICTACNYEECACFEPIPIPILRDALPMNDEIIEDIMIEYMN